MPPDRLTLEQAEARIRHRRFEIAYVFDRSGRQLFRQEGGPDYVRFRSRDLASLKDSVVLHNHPSKRRLAVDDMRRDGGPFSSHDLELYVLYDVEEGRVVTPRWRYTVRRPSNGWPADADTMVAIYRGIKIAVQRDFLAGWQRAGMTGEPPEGLVNHEVVVQVARVVGFSYRRDRV